MADTIRTLSELNNLFSDNTIGGLGEQDIRDLVVSLGVHGEIGSLAKTSITLGGSWDVLDFDAAGASKWGLNVDTTNKWIDQIPVDMKAMLTLVVRFKGDVGQDYDFTVFRDPAGTAPENLTRMQSYGHRVLNASQTVMVYWATSIQLNQGDVLQAAVRSAGNDFELLQGIFQVQRLGVQ
jgi:hypothetical protein